MIFNNPWALLFIPIPFFLAHFVSKRGRAAAFQFSSTELIPDGHKSIKQKLAAKMVYLRVMTLVLLFLALARPQSLLKDYMKKAEGTDIVLAVDVSTSMLAEDFIINKKQTNRLDVVKTVVTEFIRNRANDRIAVVVFGARPYTLCPLTLNHDWLTANLQRVYAGMLEDKTAIGSALTASLNRLKKTKAKDKVIVLLTDGRNNTGKITPMTAAEIAKALGIRIYTIGAGTMGIVQYPIKNTSGETIGYTSLKMDIDEDLLRQVAARTGGKYFRATDTKSLKKIYSEIDRLEKAPIQEKIYGVGEELFGCFLVPALFILMVEIFLSNTILMRVP